MLITWPSLFLERLGLSYTNQEKSDPSYCFLLIKNGANHIPGSTEKGGHSACICTMPYIGSYPHPEPGLAKLSSSLNK